jgi:hypothetical protein
MKPNQSDSYSVLLAPVAAATTERTAVFNLDDCNYATIDVVIGAEVNTNAADVTLTLEENDSGTTWVELAEVEVDNTAAASYQFHIAKPGRKRQMRLTVTPGTHTTNDPIIACASVSKVKTFQEGSDGTVL